MAFWNRARGIGKHVLFVLQIVCAAVVLIECVLLGILLLTGKTTLSKIAVSAKVLLGFERETITIVNEIPPAEFAMDIAKFEASKKDQEKEFSRRRKDVETFEMALQVSRKQLESERSAFDQKEAAFQRQVGDFDAKIEAYDALLADANFAKTKELLETVPAKTAVEMIKEWDINRTIVYMRALESRIVSKILQEMQKNTDPKVRNLATQIHKLLE